MEAVAELPLERLEAEIAEHAAHLAAGTCRWLLLLGEFDRRAGHESWGCRSAAQWLNWRCGISLVTAREQVRVAHRLAELPLVRAAFASGELSYSKVRAIVRIATPATEETLVMWARHATAAQLERIVAQFRRVDRVQAEEAREKRAVSWSFDDGTFVLRARLGAEEGELVLAALEAAKQALAGD